MKPRRRCVTPATRHPDVGYPGWQTTHGLTDRETFIAHAFGAGNTAELRRTDFAGQKAKSRGQTYDELAKDIIERGEDFS